MTQKLIKNYSILLGVLILSSGFIGSIYFYKERVIYIDSAYYIFNLINNGAPNAEHNRYALFLYQLLPWILLKLNCSIPLVIKTFSFSHILVHVVAFSILLKIKQHKIALLLALMQVICYRECFYLSVNETALAISSSLLLSGLLIYSIEKRNQFLNGLFCIICILIAIYSHPMALLIIPFLLIYLTISCSNINKTLIAICFGGFLAILITKKLIGNTSSYENELYEQIKNFGQITTNLPEIYSFKYFFSVSNYESTFIQLYLIPLVALALVILYNLKNKKYLLLGFIFLSNLGLWLIIVILFNRGDGNMFMEKNFAPWVLFSIYPLIDIKINENKVWLIFMLVSLYAINSVWRIYIASKPYTKRYQIVENILLSESKKNKHKLLIQDTLINHDLWLGTWALPYETLLMSKIDKIPNTSIRIYNNENYIHKELGRKDLFLGADFIPPLPAIYLLNQKYFKLFEEKYIEIRP